MSEVFQTLEELKAANAAADAQTAVVDEQQEVDEPEEVEAVEDAETDEQAEAQGEPEVEEEWLKGDSEQSQAVPLSKHVEMRHKLKARISDKEIENEQLKRRIEQLEAGGVVQQQSNQQQASIKRPRLEDFDFDQDAYDAAVDDYHEKRFDSMLNNRLSNRDQQQAQQLAEQRREEKVGQHYERAEKLIESTPGFTAEKFRAADLRVRQELHALTGNGDLVAEELIARLGEGSERVMAHLGINSAKLETLKQKLLEDSSGMTASMWLGELKANLSKASTVSKLSKAPKPDSGVKGDAGGTSSPSALMRKYREASDSGNDQKAFDLRRQAKAAGYDISKW